MTIVGILQFLKKIGKIACVSLAATIFLLLAGFQGRAVAQPNDCPSGYYQAQTASKLLGTSSVVGYTVCILTQSFKTHIDVSATISIAATDSQTLYMVLLNKLLAPQDCSPFVGLFSQNGWQIVGLNLHLQRVGGSSTVQVSGSARPCAGFPGAFSYAVPLTSKYTNGILTLGIDRARATITATGTARLLSTALRDQLSDKLTEVLASIEIDINNYVPKFVANLDPTIATLGLTINKNAVEFKVTATGQLTSANGEKLLSQATSGISIDQLLQVLKKGFAEPGV